MLPAILSLVPLVITNNIVMSGIKWLAVESLSNNFLRVILAVLSLIGIVATAAYSGTPVDFNQISDDIRLLIETIVLAVASHFSYRAIKGAPSTS